MTAKARMAEAMLRERAVDTLQRIMAYTGEDRRKGCRLQQVTSKLRDFSVPFVPVSFEFGNAIRRLRQAAQHLESLPDLPAGIAMGMAGLMPVTGVPLTPDGFDYSSVVLAAAGTGIFVSYGDVIDAVSGPYGSTGISRLARSLADELEKGMGAQKAAGAEYGRSPGRK